MMVRILSFLVGCIRNKESAAKIIALVLVLGLCAALWVQTQRIASLQAENAAQAQSIEQLNKFNEQMNKQLKAEQQAVIEQQRLTIELREKAEQVQNEVKSHLLQEPCATTTLPRAVINSLERLQ